MRVILLMLMVGFLMMSCSGAHDHASTRYEPVQDIAKREFQMEAQLERQEHLPAVDLVKFKFSSFKD